MVESKRDKKKAGANSKRLFLKQEGDFALRTAFLEEERKGIYWSYQAPATLGLGASGLFIS